jgi:hypothetical protein
MEQPDGRSLQPCREDGRIPPPGNGRDRSKLIWKKRCEEESATSAHRDPRNREALLVHGHRADDRLQRGHRILGLFAGPLPPFVALRHHDNRGVTIRKRGECRPKAHRRGRITVPSAFASPVEEQDRGPFRAFVVAGWNVKEEMTLGATEREPPSLDLSGRRIHDARTPRADLPDQPVRYTQRVRYRQLQTG